ncbi:HAMP domain-containing sensor histidine kinase [Lentzea albida]|uniref:Signal transduction histidine-protein kinase/phosphatase MprB n=1 Tax=Lentzea albida TaxID=65499 RepID=A0A1H9T9T5_9PSEU|nr:HAMP domain-containing sensor histidine kinase [Lentzea albida]SER93982.1 His Kinase A (phospho-acceptor) domain-containing protein [Lentzea albida]
MRRVLELIDMLPRPLDSVRSIKLKLGIVIVVSGCVSFAYFRYVTGWLPPRTTLIALVLGLLTSQLLAHGMTSPLREMTSAARSMASGDYSRSVRATSSDEVGQLAEAFTVMASDLAAADQQRRELIANVSHELRTPISALQAVLENVVDGVAAPDAATMRTALAQTERLGRLVTELLDLSKIDAGVLSLNRETLSVSSLVADVVAEAAVAAPAASFSIDVPGDLTVLADGERLHQVLVNLVDNAARHGPTGGLVSVSGYASGACVVLEVRDEGPGIAVADRSRIFERFTRGERAGGGGTGLGLAIARWVVDLHGGTIAVVDPGSCIRVTLPR